MELRHFVAAVVLCVGCTGTLSIDGDPNAAQPPRTDPDGGPLIPTPTPQPEPRPIEPPGMPDAGVPDASIPMPDASVPDASVPDASVPDASVPDASMPDASIPDASVPDASVPPGCNPATAPNAPVKALRIGDITVNQGVSVRIAQQGTPVSSASAPVVAGRQGVLRVFVTPQSGWVAREVVGRLQLGSRSFERRQTINAASTAANLDSTINFTLDANAIQEGARISVELFEVDPCADHAGSVSGARYPQSGTAALGAERAPGTLRVVVVPVRYGADGSNRTPAVTNTIVNRFQDTMHNMFPLTDLDISVRSAPLQHNSAVQANGNGWSQLLNDCLALRASDNAPANTYYYCAVQPAADARTYCRQGCVAGLGPVPSARDTYNRGSIGLLFDDGTSTFVHEMGHTLGLAHAPCGGVSGADPNYPHSGGRIGVRGYHFETQSLIDTERFDVMGYCDPQWISDFHYNKLYDRLATVTVAPLILKRASEKTPYRPVIIDTDNSLTAGDVVWMDTPPDGELVEVDILDTAGNLQQADGVFVSVSHLPGGIVYVPELSTPRQISIESIGVVAVSP